MDVNYDTATGELHDYISRLNSGEASLEFLERFLTATEESSGIALEDRENRRNYGGSPGYSEAGAEQLYL